jgi:hypothetical protein
MFSFSIFLLFFFSFMLYAAGSDKDGSSSLRLAGNVLQKQDGIQDVK